MNRVIAFLGTISNWRLILLLVVIAILISEALVVLQSLVIHETIRADFLVIGFITPAIDALILAFIMVAILNKLRESENRYSRAIQGSTDGIWDWNLETDEVYYSHQWKDMLGYKDHELANHIDTWKNLVHPEDKDRVLRKAQNYIAGKEASYETELRMRHKNGHDITVLARALILKKKADGKPIRLTGTHVDITLRKKAEKFSSKTVKILEMVATGKPASEVYDAIALLYESRHPGMRCSLLELQDDILLHGGAPSMPKEYCDAVHGLKNGPTVGSCGASTYTGKRCIVENIEIHPNWAEIKGAALPHGMRSCWSEPIISSQGKVMGAFGMYYNHPALPNEEESDDLKSASRLASVVMERDQNRNELNAQQKKLKQLLNKANDANKAKSEFLANMSHEIRTPMNAIIGLTKLALNGDIPVKERDFITKVHSSSHLLLGIINDILDFSKIEAKKLTLVNKDFNFASVVDDISNIINYSVADKDINFSISLPDNALPVVHGDSLRLEQVLINLCNNAVKFTHDGSVELIIRIKEQLDNFIHLYFEVRDTGIGMPEDKLEHVFDSFTQANSSTVRQYGGTGLGLPISKSLVGLMGGDLKVASEVGKGSCFYFSLCFDIGTKIVNQNNDIIDIKQSIEILAGKKVLLAEDNLFNQVYIEEVFEDVGIKLIIANNGQDALEVLEKELFDLVLMDCQMPVMDGYTTTQEIRKQAKFKELPIIAMTANVMESDIKKSLDAGMNDHIGKPIDDDTMFITMAKWVRLNQC